MDGPTIKRLRRRLGVTQEQLAAQMSVDQGTVSRWERGVELPRPRRITQLAQLLSAAEDRRVLRVATASVRHNLLAATLMDSSGRLREISQKGIDHYRVRHGVEIREQLGTSMEQHLKDSGLDAVWADIERSGLMDGSALLVRLVVSHDGYERATHYEPMVVDGELVGIYSFLAGPQTFDGSIGYQLRRLEIVHGDGSLDTIDLSRRDTSNT
jgi:transcriptional regulator with XRE-family HTH domain